MQSAQMGLRRDVGVGGGIRPQPGRLSAGRERHLARQPGRWPVGWWAGGQLSGGQLAVGISGTLGVLMSWSHIIPGDWLARWREILLEFISSLPFSHFVMLSFIGLVGFDCLAHWREILLEAHSVLLCTWKLMALVDGSVFFGAVKARFFLALLIALVVFTRAGALSGRERRKCVICVISMFMFFFFIFFVFLYIIFYI